MPQLTPEQDDDLQEAIARQLYRVNNLVKGMFGAPLSPEELRSNFLKIKQSADQALTKRTPQPQTTQPPAARPPIPMRQVAEGGFINDASGQATARERQRLGIQ